MLEYLRPSGECPCLKRLDDPTHVCVRGCLHPMAVLGMLYNHVESWESDAQFVLISHPRYLTGIVEVAALAQRSGWALQVFDKEKSWYRPGETWLVMTLGRVL